MLICVSICSLGEEREGTYEVSMDLPFWIAHADAPLPRWRAIMLVSSIGFWEVSCSLLLQIGGR